jgi:hypothetical protein
MRCWLRGLLVLTACWAFAQDASERSVGVWKLNVHKSELGAAANPAASVTRTIEKVGEKKYRDTFDIVFKDGQKQHLETVHIYDGQERQREGQAAGMTETCEVIDANRTRCMNKQEGKPIGGTTVTISADAKTMTGRFTQNRDGKQISEVRVYDKQ